MTSMGNSAIENPAIVLTHGALGSGSIWADVTERLQRLGYLNEL